MKNTKRFLALLLALMMVVCFASCKGETETGANGENGNGNGEKELGFHVPEGVAAGKELYVYIGMPGLAEGCYIAEELNGQDVNDMIYERNAAVEEYTGADITFVKTNLTNSGGDQQATTAMIRTLIQANDDTYGAFVHVQHSGMPTLIAEKMFVDWNTIESVNLNNPWWYSNVQRDICYGGKVYCMTGDYHLESFSGTECLIFSKTMCDELNLEYPYQMVFDGTWTHDKFVEYIKAATKDLNGDGNMDLDNDRFGFGGWSWEQIKATFTGYGGEEVIKDENNLPVLNIDTEMNYQRIDKLLEVFDLEGTFFEPNVWGEDTRLFQEGRLLFKDGFLKNVVGLRGLEDIDLGFVPYPKLNEEQTDYYSRITNASGLTYIPITNADVETTGAVFETMAYISNQTMLPRYFDVLLTIKSTRDVESEDMIPIIRNSARFIQQVASSDYFNMVSEGTGNTLSSNIAANRDAWELKIEETIAAYTEE